MKLLNHRCLQFTFARADGAKDGYVLKEMLISKSDRNTVVEANGDRRLTEALSRARIHQGVNVGLEHIAEQGIDSLGKQDALGQGHHTAIKATGEVAFT